MNTIHMRIALLLASCALSLSMNAQVFAMEWEDASYINASAYSPEYDAVFFFSGDRLMIHDINTNEAAPAKWFELKGLPAVDAALDWTATEILLFSGTQYRILDLDSLTFSTVPTLWPGLPEAWNDSLDACVRWSDDEVYFFKGDEYIIYNFEKEGYTIHDKLSDWEGYPESWTTKLEAVCNINGDIYFMNDGEALMYSRSEELFYGPGPLVFATSK